MDAKYCKDCAHFDAGVFYPHCKCPKATPLMDKVSGEPLPVYCNIQRMAPTLPAYCGPEAAWFESKPAIP